MTPQRMQRKRTKGYNMRAESLTLNGLPAIYVGRPSIWGNPFKIALGLCDTPQGAVNLYFDWLTNTLKGGYLIKAAEESLRGKNLACWCPLDQPCHADVLLELANR